MARATSTRLKNRFGKRFLLVFLRWQRYRILEMAFARTTALEFLRRAYEQNRLAHAYLITGAPGSGKEVLAAELTSLVNGTPTKDVFSAKLARFSSPGPNRNRGASTLHRSGRWSMRFRCDRQTGGAK